MSRIVQAIVTCVLLLAACSSERRGAEVPADGSGGSGAGGGAASAATGGTGGAPGDHGRALADAYCHAVFACCDAKEAVTLLAGWPPAPATEDECRAEVGKILAYQETYQIGYAVGNAEITFDASQVAACAAALAAAPCDTWSPAGDVWSTMLESDPACAAMVTPLSPDGGHCRHDRDCTSGICDEIPNVCVASTVGSPCSTGSDCLPAPLWCPSDTHVCADRLADGAACSGADACRSLVCDGYDPSTGTPGTCAAVCRGS